MAKTTRKIAVACLIMVAGAGTLQAQGRPKVGGQLSFANDYNFGIGVRVTGDLTSMIPSATSWGLIGSFDYFFPGNSLTYWEINGNAAYKIHLPGSTLAPYAGGGLNISHWGTSVTLAPGVSASYTRIGLNLLGGTTFPSVGSITPFAELRFELRSGGEFVVSGGALF